MSMAWDTVADAKTIRNTADALSARGIETFVAKDRTEAKEKALSLMPPGSEVYAMTSVTLEETGIAQEIEKGGRYQSARKKVLSINDKAEREQMRRSASACQYAIGSIHAVTESGQVMVVSQSGSQLAPYAYAAGKVVWVVGAQKIVSDLEAAFRRIHEHVVPLEDARAKKAYGVGTSLNKTLIIEKETVQGRIRMIIVEEKLGF